MIYADQRWIGDHGIGRFARHVLAGLDYRPIPLNSNPAAAFDSWSLTRALKGSTARDIFFSPGYNAPLFCRAQLIFTIHDLIHIYSPESRKLKIRLYYASVVKRACARATRILTVSEFSRNQIVDWSGVSPEKVVNVGCGVDAAYVPEGQTYGLSFPYLLTVSNRKPHKNEARILQAFAQADLDPQIHLVFTGRPTADLARAIEERNLRARVDFVGAVPEEKLPSLYRGAKALIFPSLYEGFGLPILEAMACGIPVVTSNITAMPEVAGDAALLVDPGSVEQITGAMEQIVADSGMRQQLREKGLRRAMKFSWGGAVSKVREVLGRCNSRGN